MVRTYSKKVMPVDTLDKIICDLCGKEIPLDSKDEIELKHVRKEGMGDYGYLICPDVCGDCWCNKILPFLRENELTRKYELWG